MKIIFRRAIVVGLLFVTPVLSQAQIESIGYNIDNSYNEITGFIDKDYEPESLYKCTLSELTYLPGGYTDLENVFHEGIIKLVNVTNKISFKSNENNEIITLKAQHLKSFVMAKDSFISATNFATNQGVMSNGFIVKYLSNVSFPIYKYTSRQGVPSYLLEVDGRLKLTPKSKKKFKLFVLPLVQRYGKLFAEIQDGTYGYEDFEKIILIYDKFIRGEDGIPTYYSKNWEQIDTKEDAYYYSEVEILDGFKSNISYFDINSNKVLDIKETFINESEKNGKFVWYYPNGHIKKEASYAAGDEVGVTSEFSDQGRLHRSYGIGVEDGKRNYMKVCNESGDELFARNGKEVYFDKVTEKELTRVYEKGVLNRIYYRDSLGRLIYQLADKNAKIKNDPSDKINSRLVYPVQSIDSLVEGLVLIKLLINPTGRIESMNIIKGVDFMIDAKVVQVFASLRKTYPVQFRPAMVNKVPVYQELVFPISFGFRTHDFCRSFYYDPMMFQLQNQMHQQMMFDMNMQMIQQNMPTFPKSY